ncbi:Mastermind-like protein 3 [Fukomys damarensis]|uniref:Mastermind-like protein 3 n=1 Tax=Fukomys damarensis TaxID=885580 RepID=A0A091EPI2_FUKDA|nr:Mastermind-like protein 3 [Fukomys damarensis]
MVSGASPAGPGFLGSQPQAAIMKQMLIDQRAQLMEQQKQQFLREQQILAEQARFQYNRPTSYNQPPMNNLGWDQNFSFNLRPRLPPGHRSSEEPGSPPEYADVTADGTELRHDGHGTLPEPRDHGHSCCPV